MSVSLVDAFCALRKHYLFIKVGGVAERYRQLVLMIHEDYCIVFLKFTLLVTWVFLSGEALLLATEVLYKIGVTEMNKRGIS